MVESYLERYLKGEYQQVWAELLALGSQIQHEPLASEALAVTTETMNRVKHNIALLKQRLYTLDYKFVADDPNWGGELEKYLLEKTWLNTISVLEKAGLTLPISLEVFYELVGSVDFRGSHPKLSKYSGFYDSEVGLGVFSDPLVVWPPDSDDIEEYRCYNIPDESLNSGYCLEIAPDEIHKANISGGSPYYIMLGDAAIDGRLLGDRNYGTFIEYLREVFRWGGFPGLATNPAMVREELAFLTKDLLPI